MTHAPADPHPSRVNFAAAAPRAFKALIGFDAAAREGLDERRARRHPREVEKNAPARAPDLAPPPTSATA
ncbi:hypothetical protein OG339_11605 [Streptosporangium sp. NBC_01495]|uniref:hypothetical protein n=1 Tax=Streptosporangium sp. NBC_01495 TaxID=2903899 RepID=UPI002E3065CF|nr:hypothetical protein [Streptosporangium sp. NBC_01495]